MRNVFLVIGIVCTLAAFYLLSGHRDFDPRSNIGSWKARPEHHGMIWKAWFSPNGERLLFRVKDESGKQSKSDNYLYSLNDRSVRKLPIGRSPGFPHRPWAANSKHIAFYERNACKVFNIETNSVVEIFRVGLQEWSADGKKQLFENYMTNDKYLRDVESGDWTVLPKEVGESRLYWSRDCTSLLYFDWDTKNIMQYGIEDGVATKLASFDGYGKRFYTLLTPSRRHDHVYFTMPRHQTEEYASKVLLCRLDLASGKIKQVFDSGLDQDKGGIGLIYLARDDNPIYYWQVITGEDGKKHRSIRKLNTSTEESEVLLEGYYSYRDYSYKTDTFAITSKNSRVLSLFSAKTKALEQIYPPE